MKEMPVTVKRSLELLGLFLLGALIVIGKFVIMPLLMAFFFSLMLMPIFRFFRRLRVTEVIAIFLPILFLAVFAALIVWLFSSQLGALLSDFPQIQRNLTKHLDALSVWVSRVFSYSPAEQLKFINEQSNSLFSSAGSILSGTAGSVSSMLLFFGLLPIYIYLIILYRGLFQKFILMGAEPAAQASIKDIMLKVEGMAKNYLVGLLIQISYLIILIWLTLLIFGIPHALLIGILFALLNLIPYLGPLIGNILGVLITLASSESMADVLIVLLVIAVVQFLDNNILMPRIVGSQVKINALVSIAGIFIGGAMAGIAGMFLAMPVIAVLKIIFDHSENFKRWGVLLGDDRPAKKSNHESTIPA